MLITDIDPLDPLQTLNNTTGCTLRILFTETFLGHPG